MVGRSRWTANRIEMAEFFGVSHETIDLWRRKGMPHEPGKPGDATAYDIERTAKWLAGQRSIRSDSEAVDGYREEKRRTAELNRLQLEGKLVDAVRYEQRLIRAIQAIRRGVESIHRSFGDSAALMLNDICDDAVRILEAESESDLTE